MNKFKLFNLLKGFKKHNIVGRSYIRTTLLVFFCLLFILSATILVTHYKKIAHEEENFNELVEQVKEQTSSPSVESSPKPKAPITAKPVAPKPMISSFEPEEPVILDKYQDLYTKNNDMIGWIKIEGTIIDYPLMYTGDDFYLDNDFEKNSSKSGTLFIDRRCTIEPFGSNTIIHGHHMKNGTMFASLLNYKNEEYYKEHPTIQFDTLYEEQEFEIIAVFESQVYKKSDTVFKYYNFLNAENESDYDEYIKNIKALSLYDIDRTARYNEQLITLSTCAYHREDGLFVVVAVEQE